MESPKNQKEAVELFRRGPDILENALAGLSDIELDHTPSDGGWTIRQIVHHLVDGDDLWKTGIKTALGNEGAEFTLAWYQALPQTEWGKRWGYENRPIHISLDLFRANRNHILQLLEFVSDGWNKCVQYINSDGGVEFIPVGFIIQMQADHVFHHVNRIAAIRKEISVT